MCMTWTWTWTWTWTGKGCVGARCGRTELKRHVGRADGCSRLAILAVGSKKIASCEHRLAALRCVLAIRHEICGPQGSS